MKPKLTISTDTGTVTAEMGELKAVATHDRFILSRDGKEEADMSVSEKNPYCNLVFGLLYLKTTGK